MNFTKIKRVLSAGVAAVMCVTMALSVPVSAKTDNTMYNNAKALTSAKYNSNYVKMVEKYSAKSTKNTVTFSKSRTKKFYENFAKKKNAKNPQFVENIISKDIIISSAMKGNNVKMVVYVRVEGMEMGLATYVDGKNATTLAPATKKKYVEPFTSDASVEDAIKQFDVDAFMSDNVGIADNAKGKYFKFTSSEKTYYYEEFETDNGTRGYLFNSNGNLLAIKSGNDEIGDLILCYSISYKVDNSEFTIPKGYTKTKNELELEDFLKISE